ncbi:MAG TPA: hypothetical protein PKM21_14600 [Anaerolineales bacterium]|nr:hypothetical protein [Anaerolineales bacterium]
MRHYFSYLLRIWQPLSPTMKGDLNTPPKETAWMASLEDPHTRQVYHFNSLAGLYQFIQQRADAPDGPPETKPVPPQPGQSPPRKE